MPPDEIIGFFVRPHRSNWIVGRGDRIYGFFDSKNRAIDLARLLMRGLVADELIVFAVNGEVEQRLRAVESA